jgi:hypothetical protein
MLQKRDGALVPSNQQKGARFTPDRIQNKDELGGKLIESFKWELCKNLLKKSIQCRKLFHLFC